MRLIIKVKKTLKEENNSSEMLVDMKSSDFLKVTTDKELMDYLRDRYKTDQMDYNALKAGKLLLFVDSNGKVISHEGRNRSYANMVKNGENAMQKVILRTESGDINKIKTLHGQFDPSISIEVSSLKKVEDSDPREIPEDILGIGNEVLTFETKIIPKGHVYPNGRVVPQDYKIKDGEKESLYLLDPMYNKIYDLLRKIKGWGPNEYSKHREVADVADEAVKKYVITDEKGILNPMMKRGSYYHMIYDRPTVGTITIKKK